MEQQHRPALIADVMLGRLARWLRLLGYDTRYDNAADDVELLRIAQAEGRVLLTRDWALSRQRGVRALWIESQELPAQLRQVQAVIGPAPNGRFTRCAVCNTLLAPIDKAQVEGRVPPYVFQTQEDFLRCPGCERLYWAATHVEHMQRMLADIG